LTLYVSRAALARPRSRVADSSKMLTRANGRCSCLHCGAWTDWLPCCSDSRAATIARLGCTAPNYPPLVGVESCFANVLSSKNKSRTLLLSHILTKPTTITTWRNNQICIHLWWIPYTPFNSVAYTTYRPIQPLPEFGGRPRRRGASLSNTNLTFRTRVCLGAQFQKVL